MIIDHVPHLADEVIGGTTALSKAYAEAKEEAKRAEGEEARADELAKVAPDLKEKVDRYLHKCG